MPDLLTSKRFPLKSCRNGGARITMRTMSTRCSSVFQQASGGSTLTSEEKQERRRSSCGGCRSSKRPAAGGEAAALDQERLDRPLCAGDRRPLGGSLPCSSCRFCPSCETHQPSQSPDPEVKESSGIICVEMTCVEEILAAEIAERAVDLALLM